MMNREQFLQFLKRSFLPWHKQQEDEDDYPRPMTTVYRDDHGTVTSDGLMFQAWQVMSRNSYGKAIHVERVGTRYPSRAEAIAALKRGKQC